MELTDIFKIIKKRWPLIFIVTLCITLGSALVSRPLLASTYRAETTVTISEPKIINKESLDATKEIDPFEMYKKQLKSYSDFAKSRIVFEHVISTLKLDMSVAQLQKIVSINPEGESGFFTISAVTKDPKLSQNLVNQFAKSLKLTSNEIKKVDNVQLTKEAALPTPSRNSLTPFLLRVCIGFFFGFMVGFGIALLLEYIDNTVKSKEEVENLTSLPIIGLLPIEEANVNLITSAEPGSKESNAYNTLMTNLQFSIKENNLKTIVVTSPKSEEGKSILLTNLAVTFAQSNKKVLILDCDLRNPSIHDNFSLINTSGITSVLLKDLEYQQCINKTQMQNLDIMTSGPVPLNSAELLGSNKFRILLNQLATIYDIVLINSTTILKTTDQQILSSICDGTILLTSYGKTEITILSESIDIVKKSDSNIIGVVINNVPNNVILNSFN